MAGLSSQDGTRATFGQMSTVSNVLAHLYGLENRSSARGRLQPRREGQYLIEMGTGALYVGSVRASLTLTNRPKKARLTVGHVVADSLQGANDAANLRTECSRCNEPAREEASRSELAIELWPKIRSLDRADKSRLFSWIQSGQRGRDEVDRLYDQYRSLPAPQRDILSAKLKRAVKGD